LVLLKGGVGGDSAVKGVGGVERWCMRESNMN